MPFLICIWKWCLLGHGRGRGMKKILGRLHLKRTKLPLISFPANKHPFEMLHRKMKRTSVRTAQLEEKDMFSRAPSELWHFAFPSWILIHTSMVCLIPFQRKLLCCVPGLYVGGVRSGLTCHARTKKSGDWAIFTVICKEKAANRQIPGCCSRVGKFFKATGSGVSSHSDLASPKSVGANFPMDFQIKLQMFRWFFVVFFCFYNQDHRWVWQDAKTWQATPSVSNGERLEKC